MGAGFETIGTAAVQAQRTRDMNRTMALQSADIREQHEKIWRPKLLFLAWYFPPARSVGCIRAWNIAKYLARLGWEVTVVTPAPSLRRDMDNPQQVTAELEREGIRLIPTDHRWRALAADSLRCWNQGFGWILGGACRRVARYFNVESEIGWTKAIERACSSLTAEDVDVILATAPPFVSFSLAKRLSERLGRPYILDYRDPWSGNPVKTHYNDSAIKKEANILPGSAGVTIVSESWRRAMDQRFNVGLKLHVLTNGYDPEELAAVKPYDFGHFAIVYAGSLYPPKKSITPIMAALSQLKELTIFEGKQWVFHYYGRDTAHVLEEAQRFRVSERVVTHGWVSRSTVLSAVRGAAVAIAITSVQHSGGVEDQGWVAGKIFETIGLGTPILIVAPPNSDIAAISQTAGLSQSFSSDNISGIAGFFVKALNGETPKSKNPRLYEWPYIIKKLDGILRQAITDTRHERCTGLPDSPPS
jgi:Glycosyl transferase 4-like domain